MEKIDQEGRLGWWLNFFLKIVKINTVEWKEGNMMNRMHPLFSAQIRTVFLTFTLQICLKLGWVKAEVILPYCFNFFHPYEIDKELAICQSFFLVLMTILIICITFFPLLLKSRHMIRCALSIPVFLFFLLP